MTQSYNITDPHNSSTPHPFRRNHEFQSPNQTNYTEFQSCNDIADDELNSPNLLSPNSSNSSTLRSPKSSNSDTKNTMLSSSPNMTAPTPILLDSQPPVEEEVSSSAYLIKKSNNKHPESILVNSNEINYNTVSDSGKSYTAHNKSITSQQSLQTGTLIYSYRLSVQLSYRLR